jgi:hypothetical protein
MRAHAMPSLLLLSIPLAAADMASGSADPVGMDVAPYG